MANTTDQTPVKPPTPEELVAAIQGQTPPAPDATGGKKFRYELGPNSVIEGDTPEEVIEKFVGAQKNANEFIGTLKEENKSLRQSAAVADRPRDESGRFVAQPQQSDAKFDKAHYIDLLGDDPINAQNYLDSFRFGIPQDRVVDTFSRTVQTSDLAGSNMVSSHFLAMCPEFPQSEEAADALVQQMEAMGAPVTPAAMRAAHLVCLADGKYKALDAATNTPTTPRAQPLPVPTGAGIPDQQPDIMGRAEQMTAADLRRAIEEAYAKGVR